MKLEEIIFGSVLLVAFGLIAFGVSLFSAPAGWITGGVLLAAWVFLMAEGR